MPPDPPKILSRQIVAKSRLFTVERLELRFSNGIERSYERLAGNGRSPGAVMVVALVDNEHALLVEEYCAGSADYQLSLPKGLIEADEAITAAANRELQEEAGFAANKLEYITDLGLSPAYMSQRIAVVLARDLFEQRLPGDEPEPIRVDKISLHKLYSLVSNPQFTDGRALAALYLVRDLLQQRGEL